MVYRDCSRFEARRSALAGKLGDAGIDAFVTTHPQHVLYLSGFTGSNGGVLLHADGAAKVATDGRYTTQISEQVPDLECLLARACDVDLIGELTEPIKVGVEADHISVSRLKLLEERVPDCVTLVPVTGLVEKQRLIKDDSELEDLRRVAALASEALEQLLDAGELAIGRSERDVAADLEFRMRKLGAECVSFDTIIASGENSAKPHHGAGDRILRPGDIVTIDYGAHLNGYNSDCTRTFLMEEETDFSREIYDLVHKSQLAGVAAATPGTPLKDVDKACRDVIEAAGYGEYFVHSTGHGVGLDVHEAPAAATSGTGVLEPGMTVTIEPGVYIPGKGGVRIEDTLIVTDGEPEVITTLPKERTVITGR